jgi:pilus assembly protein CpaB
MQKSARAIIRLFFIPLLVATAVTAALFVTMNRSKPAAPAPEPKVQVVVAAKEIPAHTVVKAGDLALAQVPAALVGHGEFTRIDAVVGHIATQTLLEGQILLGGQVIDPEKGALAYQVPNGLRAMTLRVDEYSGTGGFPNAGDRVDVVLTLPRNQEAGRPNAISRLLAQNVLVLARGPKSEPEGDKAKVDLDARVTSYTVAVTPDQAISLALGQQEGQLTLILRPVPNPPAVTAPIITDVDLTR